MLCEGRLESWQSAVVLWQTTSRGVFVCSDLAALGASDGLERQEYDAGYRSFAGAVIRDSSGSGEALASCAATSVSSPMMKSRRWVRSRKFSGSRLCLSRTPDDHSCNAEAPYSRIIERPPADSR